MSRERELLHFVSVRSIRAWWPTRTETPALAPAHSGPAYYLARRAMRTGAAARLHVALWEGYRERYTAATKPGAWDDVEAAFAWGGHHLHLLAWGGLVPKGQVSPRAGASRHDLAEVDAVLARAYRVLWGPAIEAAVALRGSGWVVVVYGPADEDVRAVPIENHDLDALGTGWPLIGLDCWEHAWLCDRGVAGRREWLVDYSRLLNWDVVEYRLREALDASG